MSSHFSRSLRTLDADSPRRTAIVFVLIVAFLSVWGGWFVAGRVAVYASSSAARLEVDRENHPVEALVGGRVIALHVAVGQSVKAGDILLELDASAERLARSQEEVAIAPALSQLVLMKEQLAAHQRALEGERQAARAAVSQGDADARRARADAEFAKDEAKRITDLQKMKLVSDLEALRVTNVAQAKQNEAESAGFGANRIVRDLEAREQDRLAQIAKLKTDIAAIEGSRAQAVAATNRLGYDIEQRVVRASVNGVVADVTSLTVGSVVNPGTRICTIVPKGDLKVVAQFRPSVALGRVKIGQPAQVRLEGFPWTQYGTPLARVSMVSGEPRSGTIRVELTLDSGQALSMIPMQHGLPAEVDVEVEQASPASLVLRSVGAFTQVSAAER